MSNDQFSTTTNYYSTQNDQYYYDEDGNYIDNDSEDDNSPPINTIKAGIIETILDYPRDKLTDLIEDYELIDWNWIAQAFSWPCGIFLNVLYISVQLARVHSSMIDTNEDYYLFSAANAAGGGANRDENAIAAARYLRELYGPSPGGKYRKNDNSLFGFWGNSDPLLFGFEGNNLNASDGMMGNSWTKTLSVIQILMLLLSIGIVWKTLRSTRKYQLRLRDIDEKAKTSNYHLVSGRVRPSLWARFFPGSLIWRIWKKIRGENDSEDNLDIEMWELHIWDPPAFFLNIACLWSPIQLLLLSALTMSNCYYIIPLAALVAVQALTMKHLFLAMVSDREELYRQVQNEYNAVFVNPRLFVAKKDVGVSVDMDQVYPENNNINSQNTEEFVYRYTPSVSHSTGSPILSHLATPTRRQFVDNTNGGGLLPDLEKTRSYHYTPSPGKPGVNVKKDPLQRLKNERRYSYQPSSTDQSPQRRKKQTTPYRKSLGGSKLTSEYPSSEKPLRTKKHMIATDPWDVDGIPYVGGSVRIKRRANLVSDRFNEDQVDESEPGPRYALPKKKSMPALKSSQYYRK